MPDNTQHTHQAECFHRRGYSEQEKKSLLACREKRMETHNKRTATTKCHAENMSDAKIIVVHNLYRRHHKFTNQTNELKRKGVALIFF